MCGLVSVNKELTTLLVVVAAHSEMNGEKYYGKLVHDL